MTNLEYEGRIWNFLVMKIGAAAVVTIGIVFAFDVLDVDQGHNVEQLTPEENQKQSLTPIEQELRKEKDLLARERQLLVEQRRRLVRAIDHFTVIAPVGEWSKRFAVPGNGIVDWAEAEDIPFRVRNDKGEVVQQYLAKGQRGTFKTLSNWMQFRSMGQKPLEINIVIMRKQR